MNNGNKKGRIINIVLIVVLAFLAGGVGELVARVYLVDRIYGVQPFGDLNLSGGLARSGIVIREPKKVVVEQNDKISDTVNSVKYNLAGIFKKQDTTAAKALAPANFYRESDALGQAVIITSDGWLATKFSGFGTSGADLAEYVVITQDQKVYAIDKVVTDKLTKFVFLHIPATDLPVRNFVEKSDVQNGQLVLAVDWHGRGWVTNIAEIDSRPGGEARSSDLYDGNMALVDNPPADFSSPALFNLAGEIVGLFNQEGKAELIGDLRPAIDSLFKLKAIRRPSLGVRYLEAADLIPASENIKKQSGDFSRGIGALLAKGAAGPAVAKGSPAEAAGLREGDIIITLDGVEVNEANDLVDLVGTLSIGEQVSVVYLRNGERKTATVKIGELK